MILEFKVDFDFEKRCFDVINKKIDHLLDKEQKLKNSISSYLLMPNTRYDEIDKLMDNVRKTRFAINTLSTVKLELMNEIEKMGENYDKTNFI